jgi:hypothetical protein
MGSENVLVVDKITHLPSFCAFAFKEDDPRDPAWIDFWAVEPCGNADADYARGQKCADEAIWHVRRTGQRALIECVLIFMGIKLGERNRGAGELEQGFTDRIAEDFPRVMDVVRTRVLHYRQGKSRPCIL